MIVDFMVTPGRRITALRPIDQSVFIDPALVRKKLASDSISPDRINNRGREDSLVKHLKMLSF